LIPLLPVGLLGLATCTSPNPPGSQQAAVTEARAEALQRLLPWGGDASSVGLVPAGPEHPAQGVSAVAVGPEGTMYLLDRLNQRVLRVSADAVETVATVPEDTEDLAVGPDGALALYSPLRSRVWIYAEGKLAGEVEVPRALHQIQSLSLGPSRRVMVHDAHQETRWLGSPIAPQTLPAILHSKREGRAFLEDGSGVVVVRLPDGRPDLRVLSGSERPAVRTHFVLPEPVLAARILGVARDQVCLRLEQGSIEEVRRRAVCVDAASGKRVLDVLLAPPGLYAPRRELALGGSPASLAFIHPEREGLRIRRWVLGEEGGVP
jgi:hypothetical protein